MLSFINSPLTIGSLIIPNRLIQGPLAGTSCSSFRRSFSLYQSPAYSVSEMLSAQDVMTKHDANGRYLHRDPAESLLAYQISGADPRIMADAADKLEQLGANLIDINCGCPKQKIRKKGAGSALLEKPNQLVKIIQTIKQRISCPLTVKIRILAAPETVKLAQQIQEAGADALIVHARRAQDDYSVPCDWQQLIEIKKRLTIPLILNGDIRNAATLSAINELMIADAFMLSRQGTGNPHLYKALLEGHPHTLSKACRTALFISHLNHLAKLENEFTAILQSKRLVRYYYSKQLDDNFLQHYYTLSSLKSIKLFLTNAFGTFDPTVYDVD